MAGTRDVEEQDIQADRRHVESKRAMQTLGILFSLCPIVGTEAPVKGWTAVYRGEMSSKLFALGLKL